MNYDHGNLSHRKVIEAKLEKISKELFIASRSYNAKNLRVTMLISGNECNTGNKFNHILDISAGSQDCDLNNFFNSFAASCAAQKLLLQSQLCKAVGETVPF